MDDHQEGRRSFMLTTHQQERSVLGTPYGRAFHLAQQDGSYRSASVIVPSLLSLFPFESVRVGRSDSDRARRLRSLRRSRY